MVVISEYDEWLLLHRILQIINYIPYITAQNPNPELIASINNLSSRRNINSPLEYNIKLWKSQNFKERWKKKEPFAVDWNKHFFAWRVSSDAPCVRPNAPVSKCWELRSVSEIKKGIYDLHEDLAPCGEPRPQGFLFRLFKRRVVGSTGGCALADTAAKTPPGRQGLANITGQQCADRHHATRLLLRGASLWARAVPRDTRQPTRASPRKFAPRKAKWFVVKEKKKKEKK